RCDRCGCARIRARAVSFLAALRRAGGRTARGGAGSLWRDRGMTTTRRDVSISTADATLSGEVWLPPSARGIVLFAHGSGSSRLSPRNRFVADEIVRGGIGTLLFDLLTPAEERRDRRDASLRFDIGLLTERLA